MESMINYRMNLLFGLGKLCKCTLTLSLNAILAVAPNKKLHVRQKTLFTDAGCVILKCRKSSVQDSGKGRCICHKVSPFKRATADRFIVFSFISTN